MLNKQYIKSRKVWKVTFGVTKDELPQGIKVKSLNLVGEFNGWDLQATPMKRMKDGVYKATLEFVPGTQAQFRYLANGEVWFNDTSADGYTPNGFGEENCLVDAA